jgi:heme-degrading monooxygenase HmoA
LINVFTVAPEDQQRLVDLLVEATGQVMSRQPGYLAANIHRSLDGTKVTNYAQWRSREDFQALACNPEAAAHMRRAQELATFEPASTRSSSPTTPEGHLTGPSTRGLRTEPLGACLGRMPEPRRCLIHYRGLHGRAGVMGAHRQLVP